MKSLFLEKVNSICQAHPDRIAFFNTRIYESTPPRKSS